MRRIETASYWHRIRQAVGNETLIVPSAAGAIVQNGRVLLVRHRALGKWQIPGGVQELGESIQETIHREIAEELGLDMTARDLLAVYSSPRWLIEFPDGSRIQQLLFFFLMDGKVAQIRLQESEITTYCFVRPGEVPEDTMECCKQKIVDLFHYKGQTIFR